jgi:hypothetical protein
VSRNETRQPRGSAISAAEVEAVPAEEVKQGCDGENGGCAFGPCGRHRRVGWDVCDQRALSMLDGPPIIEDCEMEIWGRRHRS